MNTQEVRIPWVWDTTGVERGAQNIERAATRVKKAMEAGGGAGSGMGAGPHGKGNNMIWALRDFAEGRTGYAIMRMLSALKISATGVGAISIGYVLAKQFQEAREELDKLAKDLRQLGEQNRETSRQGLFATPGMGGNTLLGESMAQFRVQQAMSNKQLEVEDELNPGKHPVRAFVNLLDKVGRGAATAVGIPVDSKTEVERAQQQAELDRRVAAKADPRLARIASEGFAGEASIASQWRTPYKAHLEQLAVERQTALARAEINGASDADKENISSKFRFMTEAVQGAQEIKDIHFRGALALQGISGGSKIGVRRALALAAQEGRTASAVLQSEGATEDERRAAELALGGSVNARNTALMGLYLNPDGRRRRQADIHRDLRNERHAEQRRARFLRHIDRIDPETGFHRTLQSGRPLGISSEGDWRLQFVPVLKEVVTVLKERLPKEIAQ